MAEEIGFLSGADRQLRHRSLHAPIGERDLVSASSHDADDAFARWRNRRSKTLEVAALDAPVGLRHDCGPGEIVEREWRAVHWDESLHVNSVSSGSVESDLVQKPVEEYRAGAQDEVCVAARSRF